jgi:hypothetical protein
MKSAPKIPTYEQIMSREHYVDYRDYRGHEYISAGCMVMYHTFTGSIRTRCQWMVPGTHPEDTMQISA